MSLLLQALRQIESRSPECLPPCDAPAAIEQAPLWTIAAAAPLPNEAVEPCEAPPARLKRVRSRELLFAESVLPYLGSADRVVGLLSADDPIVADAAAARLAFGLAAHSNGRLLLIEPARTTLRLSGGGPIVDWADLIAERVSEDDAVRAVDDERVGLLRFAPPREQGAIADAKREWPESFGHYRRIVLNAGGVDAWGVALLSSACDAVFLVIRLGESSRRQVQGRIDRLRHAGVALRACVVVERNSFRTE